MQLVAAWTTAIAPGVLDTEAISAAECVAVVTADVAGDAWIAVLVAIVDVGTATVFEVLTSALETVLKAATLEVAVLAGWGVPTAGTLAVSGRRWSLGPTVLCDGSRGGKQCQREDGCCDANRLHEFPFEQFAHDLQ